MLVAVGECILLILIILVDFTDRTFGQIGRKIENVAQTMVCAEKWPVDVLEEPE